LVLVLVLMFNVVLLTSLLVTPVMRFVTTVHLCTFAIRICSIRFSNITANYGQNSAVHMLK